MKRISLFLSLFVVMSLACDLSVAVGPASNTPAPVTNTGIPSAVPATQVPASPIPETPSLNATATQPLYLGEEITAGPLSIALSPEVAGGAHAVQIPQAGGDNVAPWDVTPGHFELVLESYYLQNTSQEPRIYVYPAQAYAEMYPAAFESMHRLNNIFGSGTSTSPVQLPSIPFFNAQQLFAPNIQPVSFQNGKGIRFLTEYAQYPASANNQDLFYQFQGLTNDGAYYIIAILPIRHPALADGSDAGAALPSGGIPYPNMDDPNVDWPGYYGSVTTLLDSSTQDVFTPRLDLLDSLIQSIRINQ